MPKRVKNVIFVSIILIFSLFNIYKSLNNQNNQQHFRFFFQPHSEDNIASHNKSTFDSVFLLDHTPLKEKLLKLGKPHNNSHYNTTYVVIDNKKHELPFWQLNLRKQTTNTTKQQNIFGEVIEESRYLVVVLQVRLYSYDKAKWSINELKQWIHYLLLAGVEHFLVCDHYVFQHEKIQHQLAKYQRLGLLTYLPWNTIRNPMLSQVKCYQRFIKHYKNFHLWHMAIDIDEYPFSPIDHQENFLVRYLQGQPDDVSEVSMTNFLMLGKGNRADDMVVRRIQRMTKQPANKLSKPIYRPDRIASVAIHHNHISKGSRRDAPVDSLRLLHYWGGRDQGWGEDTEKTLDITEQMQQMAKVWANRIENSLITFGDRTALSNLTGP